MMTSLEHRLADPAPLEPEDVAQILDTFGAGAEVRSVRTLELLAGRPETPEEVERFARELRHRAVRFDAAGASGAVDLCGSGGASFPTFNVSTVSAFVVAAANFPVAKHGNRSARGPCGSSDLLEALGLPVARSRDFAVASFERFGLAFLHAPLYHPAMRAVAEARRRFGRPTIFNRLGPLLNPARVGAQLVGVGDPASAVLVSLVLGRMGVRRGASAVSSEGADEFSPHFPTWTVEWSDGRRTGRAIDPVELLDRKDREGEWGPMEPALAARETTRLLQGGRGARRGAILLTSGATLRVAGASKDLEAGVERARVAIDSGAAAQLLEDLQQLAGSQVWEEATP
jgi:anthranilate phosphoribosyltransferase